MLAEIDRRIPEVICEAISILFPAELDASSLIKRHVWRDRRYVGEHKGRPVSWRGWSANLVTLDSHYRAVFVDVVDNVLPIEEGIRLFGEEFAAAIDGLDRYVVLFVLDFPIDAVPQICQQGFIPRQLTRSVHACAVASTGDFLDQPPLYWAAKLVKLVMFQRLMSTHRKPLELNELPLQQLLFRTGYLHSYIVRGGLGLLKLTPPRRAGQFGHDFQAVVTNPVRHIVEPFLIGIEVYTGAMGYHVETIPAYIREFGLKGIIVIAKDNPFPRLQAVTEPHRLSVQVLPRLIEMGTGGNVGLHHLDLAHVITELAASRDELEAVLP